MNDIECICCLRPCTSFGVHPICLRCTRQQAACLPEVEDEKKRQHKIAFHNPFLESTYNDG